jgi:hypothetical protein
VKHGAALLILAFLAACSAGGDPPAQVNPNPLGTGMRLRDVQDPSKNACGGKPCAGQSVNVTSVVVTAVDNFDETKNGKSRGTIFVQDADIAGPLAGISMYAPTFVPANLRLAPGDVIDLSGQYVEQQTIGSTVNFAPNFLPQMNKPQVQASFETQLPTPVVVPFNDLIQFSTARKWIGMLVTVLDVTVPVAPGPSDSTGLRVTAELTSIVNGPAINNELFDLQPWNGTNTSNSFPAGTHFKSVTGIVDFFFSIFIAPRSMADLVQ